MDKAEAEAIKEKNRNITMGLGLIFNNVQDAVVLYTGPDGNFHWATENRTWAIGAVRRASVTFDECEKIDARNLNRTEHEEE